MGSKDGCLCLAQSWASCPAQNHATLALSALACASMFCSHRMWET